MNSKRKGSAGERELLDILSQHGTARRNDQTYSGKGNPNIDFSANGRQYHVEVKRVERLNLAAAITQAETDAAPDHVPVVIHRRNRQPWYITLRLSDFLNGETAAVQRGNSGETEGQNVDRMWTV